MTDRDQYLKQFHDQVEANNRLRELLSLITPQMLRCLSGHHDVSELAHALKSPTKCNACRCVVFPED